MLNIPLAEAQSQLSLQISAGRRLIDSDIANLQNIVKKRDELNKQVARFMRPKGPATRTQLSNQRAVVASDTEQKMTQFFSALSIWREYNLTWLERCLSKEAQQQYPADRHTTAIDEADVRNPRSFNGYRVSALIPLQDISRKIEKEIANLQSVNDRLHLWPSSDSSPARAASHNSPGPAPSSRPKSEASIFIIHGADIVLAERVAHFVEHATGRVPVILHEQPNQGQTIIEKFEQHAAYAAYAIAILSADDKGGRTNESNFHPRARQNVIFEMGYFCGLIGRNRVCALLISGVEKPSDIDGIVYVALDDHAAWKYELLRELRQAGFSVTPKLVSCLIRNAGRFFEKEMRQQERSK